MSCAFRNRMWHAWTCCAWILSGEHWGKACRICWNSRVVIFVFCFYVYTHWCRTLFSKSIQAKQLSSLIFFMWLRRWFLRGGYSWRFRKKVKMVYIHVTTVISTSSFRWCKLSNSHQAGLARPPQPLRPWEHKTKMSWRKNFDFTRIMMQLF